MFFQLAVFHPAFDFAAQFEAVANPGDHRMNVRHRAAAGAGGSGGLRIGRWRMPFFAFA